MRFVSYVVLMMCIAIAAYLFGLQSPAVAIYAAQGDQPFDLGDFLYALATSVGSDQNMLFLLGALGAIGIGSLLLGFSAMYVIPLMILTVVLNLFVFPISSITGAGAGIGEFGMLLTIIFNTLGILAVLNFVRGGT